jgi:hypothetical protein
MTGFLTEEELAQLTPSELATYPTPIPTQVVSSAKLKADYEAAGPEHLRYGYVNSGGTPAQPREACTACDL